MAIGFDTPSTDNRAWLVLILVALVIVTGAWLWGTQHAGPDDGTLLNPRFAPTSDRQWTTGAPLQEVHDPDSPLRTGDVIVAIDGVPLTAPAPQRRSGDIVRYTYVRDDVRRQARIQLHEFDMPKALWQNLDIYLLPLVLFAVAALVLFHQPRERSGQLMLAAAVFYTAGTDSLPMGVRVIDLAGGRGVWPYVCSEIFNNLLWGTLLHFAITFPEPLALLGRRPRLVRLCYVVPFALYSVGLAVSLPQARSQLASLEQLIAVSAPAARVVPVMIIGLFAFAYRRTRHPVSRRRFKYVLVSLIYASAAYFLLAELPDALFGHPLVDWGIAQLGFIICPLAMAAAILRWGLFDVQIILKRSLVFSLLTGCLLVIYVVTLGGFTRWFPERSPFAAFVAGSLVALCFNPLRSRLQRQVSKLMYGNRDDPYQVVSDLARLNTDADPHAALRRAVETLAHTLRLSYVAVVLNSGPLHYRKAASVGEQHGEPLSLCLGVGEPPAGWLLLEVMPGREPFGPADRRLLEDVARQVGRVTDLVLLNSALKESRAQIIAAREEERRRLHRDLHDGIGPSLAAQSMQLEVARTLLRTDPEAADRTIEHISREAQATIAEIRRVVDDLRPKALDQLGLVSGIRERCDAFIRQHGDTRGLKRINVAAPDLLPNLPAAVEVAAYRITLEAVTNATRHAHATTCSVELRLQDGVLAVEVRDNGVGLPVNHRPGVGLRSMRDRATELGGELSVRRMSSGGTIVSAILPLTEDQPALFV